MPTVVLRKKLINIDEFLENCHQLSLPDVVIPNIFSPNSDGLNDHLEVFFPSNLVKPTLITIYNRFGGLVKEVKLNGHSSKIAVWNNEEFEAKNWNPGVFVVKVEYIKDDSKKHFYSDVTVVK